MNKKNHKNNYCILKDPHLIYYLQSPVKIEQLLSSGLYELQDNNLLHVESRQRLQISKYVLGKMPVGVKDKFDKNKENVRIEKNELSKNEKNNPTSQTKLKKFESTNNEYLKQIQIKGFRKFKKKAI